MAKRMTKSERSRAVVAEVCLYGAAHCGYGFLVRTAKGTMAGDGEPKAERSSLTSTLWLALDEAQKLVEAETGKAWGRVAIFAPGGENAAECSLTERAYFGSLAWGAAPVYTVDVSSVRS